MFRVLTGTFRARTGELSTNRLNVTGGKDAGMINAVRGRTTEEIDGEGAIVS